MKQFILTTFLCTGCAIFTPESGLYMVDHSPKINTCGPQYEMGDWGQIETSVFVDLENNQVIFDNDVILELENNEANMEEIIYEVPNANYTLTAKGEWFVKWSEPKVASGAFGLAIYCGGICPQSSFHARVS